MSPPINPGNPNPPTAADVESYLAQGRQLMRDIKSAYADDPATQIADAKADINGRMQAVKAQIDALTTRVAALESKVGP